MNTTDTVLSSNIVKESELVNKGFVIIDILFKQSGWHLVKNETNRISYTKFGDESSVFDIKFLSDSVIVSIPIKNSPYQYVTSFNNYYDASVYIEQRLNDYMK